MPAVEAGLNACRCERCCPENPRWTDTEAYRLECLARSVLSLPTPEARRAWLDGWYTRHGKASTDALKAEIRRLWEARTA